MTELFKNLNRSGMSGKGSADSTREAAVAAALEVIARSAGSGSPSVNISYEFEQLSTYADQIQEALKVK